jgi:hypothetical protein
VPGVTTQLALHNWHAVDHAADEVRRVLDMIRNDVLRRKRRQAAERRRRRIIRAIAVASFLAAAGAAGTAHRASKRDNDEP